MCSKMTISLTPTPNFAQFQNGRTRFRGTKPGHHAVTSFTKPGPAILTWPISFAPCLLISIIKSTKWRFLSSLFINRSFNTFRSIQCEQFKEKLSEIRGWSQADRHFAAHYLIPQLIYDVSSDSRKWLIKHLFPASSCKKQINKQNSYLLLAFWCETYN